MRLQARLVCPPARPRLRRGSRARDGLRPDSRRAASSPCSPRTSRTGATRSSTSSSSTASPTATSNNDFNVEPGSLGQYQGGDWKGIEDHLDYLQALGVTTLWISPIVQNVDTDADIDGYHGYWQQDLTQLNPHFGDLASLRSMVAAAHDRGMKVVLDIVCNHMGQVFFYDINLNGRPDDYVNGSGGPDDPIVQVSEYDPPWQPGRRPLVQPGGHRADARPSSSSTIRPSTGYRRSPASSATAGAYHGFGHIDELQRRRAAHPRRLHRRPEGPRDRASRGARRRSSTRSRRGSRRSTSTGTASTPSSTSRATSGRSSPATRARASPRRARTTFSCSARRSTATTSSSAATRCPGCSTASSTSPSTSPSFSNVFENAHDPTPAQGTDQIQALWEQKTTDYGTQPQPGGIGIAPYKALVNFIDNHDVPRFLFDSNGRRRTRSGTRSRCSSPRTGSRTSTTAPSRSSPAATTRRTARCSGPRACRPTATRSRTSRTSRASARRTSRSAAGDTKVVWSSPHVAQEDDAGIFAFERAGGDAGRGAVRARRPQHERLPDELDVQRRRRSCRRAQPAGTTLVDVLDPAQATYPVGGSGQLQVQRAGAEGHDPRAQGQVTQGLASAPRPASRPRDRAEGSSVAAKAVLGLLVRLAWLVGWLVALPWLLAAPALRADAPGTYLLVEIDGPVAEIVAPRRDGGLPPLPARSPCTRCASSWTRRCATSTSAGLLLVIKSMRAGLATAASLRAVLGRARSAGKRVVVHLPLGGGTRETYVAMQADRVFLGPNAGLAPVGVLASARYLRGALDRAGIVPEVHAHGRYKTAGERIERDVDERRRARAARRRPRSRARRGRASHRRRAQRRSGARACAIVDGAPYTGDEAVKAGLVDDTAYEDELPARLAEGGKRPPRPGRPTPIWRCVPRSVPARFAGPGSSRSSACTAPSRASAGFPSVPWPSTSASSPRSASRAPVPRVRGVVLHVDSPGGGALASDRIHHELVQLAAEKPLVACMGNVAASGGYYVAAAAHVHRRAADDDHRVDRCRRGTRRPRPAPRAARRGHGGAPARSARAPARPPPAARRRRASRSRPRDRAHLSRVPRRRRGRKTQTVEEIEPLAQGRVWIGADAHARGLVDRLGGFEDALEAVRERIGKGAGRLRVRVAPSAAQAVPRPRAAGAQVRAPAVRGSGGAGRQAFHLDASLLALHGERVLAFATSLPRFG